MQLLIDTTEQNKIILELAQSSGKVLFRKEKPVTYISEHLLLEIENLLKLQRIKLQDITKILVNPGPGGFSSTRTGVATANALAYALGIPVAEWPGGKIRKLILPKYNKAPNITKPTSPLAPPQAWGGNKGRGRTKK